MNTPPCQISPVSALAAQILGLAAPPKDHRSHTCALAASRPAEAAPAQDDLPAAMPPTPTGRFSHACPVEEVNILQAVSRLAQALFSALGSSLPVDAAA